MLLDGPRREPQAGHRVGVVLVERELRSAPIVVAVPAVPISGTPVRQLERREVAIDVGLERGDLVRASADRA